MPGNQLIWLVAVWSSAVSAFRSELSGKETFSLVETTIERTEPWSGLHAIRKDYVKHGLDIPTQLEEAVNRLAPPGQTTVAATPLPGDREYNVKVQIGNKTFTLELDTGSSDLYVVPRISLFDSSSC
jgi:hypothetical protein